jgi:hypothetical protein
MSENPSKSSSPDSEAVRGANPPADPAPSDVEHYKVQLDVIARGCEDIRVSARGFGETIDALKLRKSNSPDLPAGGDRKRQCVSEQWKKGPLVLQREEEQWRAHMGNIVKEYRFHIPKVLEPEKVAMESIGRELQQPCASNVEAPEADNEPRWVVEALDELLDEGSNQTHSSDALIDVDCHAIVPSVAPAAEAPSIYAQSLEEIREAIENAVSSGSLTDGDLDQIQSMLLSLVQ